MIDFVRVGAQPGCLHRIVRGVLHLFRAIPGRTDGTGTNLVSVRPPRCRALRLELENA
jgi:hypothetical protein